MYSSMCKKVVSLLSLYIENKLDDEDRVFIENHFITCDKCYQKYLEMKEIMANLHFEYEKLLIEFEKIENNKIFNIREYESFYKNISPYIDDELCYDDCIKFRKYLLKSKSARAELANAYNLKNNIKHSVVDLKNNVNINFSKKIVKKLKNETKDSFENIYRRAAIVIGFMITSIVLVSLYMGFNYFHELFAKNSNQNTMQIVDFPSDEDYVEFIFDKNNKPLLTAK